MKTLTTRSTLTYWVTPYPACAGFLKHILILYPTSKDITCLLIGSHNLFNTLKADWNIKVKLKRQIWVNLLCHIFHHDPTNRFIHILSIPWNYSIIHVIEILPKHYLFLVLDLEFNYFIIKAWQGWTLVFYLNLPLHAHSLLKPFDPHNFTNMHVTQVKLWELKIIKSEEY